MKMQEKLNLTFWQTLKTTTTGKLNDFIQMYPDGYDITCNQICYNSELNPVYDAISPESCAIVVLAFYAQKWERLANVFLETYNPIENYNMSENVFSYVAEKGETESYNNYTEKTSTAGSTGTTIKSGKQVTGVSANENGATITDAQGETVTATTYGTTFDNMETDRKTGKTENVGTSVNEQLNAGYTEHSIDGDKNRQKNVIDDSLTVTDTITETIVTPTRIDGTKTKRSGNIGVTTTQNMIKQEMELAEKNLLINIICHDVAMYFAGGVWNAD